MSITLYVLHMSVHTSQMKKYYGVVLAQLELNSWPLVTALAFYLGQNEKPLKAMN